LKEHFIKSTCPKETDYYTYNCVHGIYRQTLGLGMMIDIVLLRFPNLRSCSTSLFLNDGFWIYNPSHNKLHILYIISSHILTHSDPLQALVDKAPYLYMLT
jgi:hypothetical protein